MFGPSIAALFIKAVAQSVASIESAHPALAVLQTNPSSRGRRNRTDVVPSTRVPLACQSLIVIVGGDGGDDERRRRNLFCHCVSQLADHNSRSSVRPELTFTSWQFSSGKSRRLWMTHTRIRSRERVATKAVSRSCCHRRRRRQLHAPTNYLFKWPPNASASLSLDSLVHRFNLDRHAFSFHAHIVNTCTPPGT
jgi:hypothetical protein